MWYMTDPEELKNYRCKISLKKAKENLIRRYSYLNGDNLRHEPEHSLSRSLSPVLRDNLWYTGISSNPLLSLTALLLRCQGATIMQCDIREGGYDLYFDARTSQSGCPPVSPGGGPGGGLGGALRPSAALFAVL